MYIYIYIYILAESSLETIPHFHKKRLQKLNKALMIGTEFQPLSSCACRLLNIHKHVRHRRDIWGITLH